MAESRKRKEREAEEPLERNVKPKGFVDETGALKKNWWKFLEEDLDKLVKENDKDGFREDIVKKWRDNYEVIHEVGALLGNSSVEFMLIIEEETPDSMWEVTEENELTLPTMLPLATLNAEVFRVYLRRTKETNTKESFEKQLAQFFEDEIENIAEFRKDGILEECEKAGIDVEWKFSVRVRK